jgi:hypothetical protein
MSQPPQFRLAALFVVVTIISFVLAAMFAFPWWLSLPLLFVFTCSIPAALIIIVIDQGGYPRAFGVGALVPTSIVAFWTGLFVVQGAELGFGDLIDGAMWLWIAEVVACAVGVVAGLVSTAVHWLVAERESNAKKSDHNGEALA